MNRFLGFVRKEFFHIFRDKQTLLILFGMPIAQMLIFGFVISNEIRNVGIAILDQSHDVVTQKITDKILSSGYFLLEYKLSSPDEIEQVFRGGKVKEVVVFEPQFERKLARTGKANVQIIADASDANLANLISTYTTGIIQDYVNRSNAVNPVPMRIVPEVRMVYNEQLRGAFLFVPGIMALILVLISALMTSISITREKEMGTMEILLVSPLKPIQIIIGKVVPYTALAFINAVTILLLGNFVFGVPIQGSVILLLLECMLYILLALSLGILISSVTDNQMVAMMLSAFALMLPVILLSGFIFPIENMPLILQWICQLMPPKWFIIIIKSIMLKGAGIGYIWKETLILMGMTVLFLTISLKKFKIRLE
ncbi:ABC transporter permease [bacterium]|nr:ABC transporter permease [bacterium]MBU1064152.1 ABC transporter permease [bacterium]MBU1635663.1 ABC transporter permease [bacterium]MBU1873823.1 ABC transporter permease [bacterium]